MVLPVALPRAGPGKPEAQSVRWAKGEEDEGKDKAYSEDKQAGEDVAKPDASEDMKKITLAVDRQPRERPHECTAASGKWKAGVVKAKPAIRQSKDVPRHALAWHGRRFAVQPLKAGLAKRVARSEKLGAK